MGFGWIVEALENAMERLCRRYFQGEWLLPWLPDDL